MSELSKFLWLFLSGIIRYFYLLTLALVLDPFDFFERILNPLLPRQFQFSIPWSSMPTTALSLCLLILATFLIFHDARMLQRSEGAPDFSAHDVFKHMLTRSKWGLGKAYQEARLFNSLNTELRDAARLGQIQVWGREVTRVSGVMPSSLEEIGADFWKEGHFNYIACLDPSFNVPEAQWIRQGADTSQFSSVTFSKRQIFSKWPKANYLSLAMDKNWKERRSFFDAQESLHGLGEG